MANGLVDGLGNAVKIVAFLSLAVVVLSLSSGATRPVEKHYTQPNAAFFFANNDDYYEAFSAVAVMMCIQDKVTNDSPESLRQAATKCRDSQTDEDGDPITHDGGWHAYTYPAIDMITQMCKANSAKLCESYR